jgi:hypothetical protein
VRNAFIMNDEIERSRNKSTLFCCMVLDLLHNLPGVSDENKKKYPYPEIRTGDLPNTKHV